MTIHALCALPPTELALALAAFETRFIYPLGPGRSFKISHGDDYPRFFRAMGNARCFVSEHAGRVTGALGVAIRPILLPDGQKQQIAYIGDLKVDPAARGSLVFLRLAQAAVAWAKPQVTAAFGVVMDGTRASPTEYTGRIGLPSFLPLGKIVVLRIPTATQAKISCPTVEAAAGEDCHGKLSHGRYSAVGGNPFERSAMQVRWLIHPNGLACGRLEDTRLAKRLIAGDGIEMQSAHLSCFAWKSPHAAAELIHAALRHAAEAGLPALFMALSEVDKEAVEMALGPMEKVMAPATIYGTGFAGHQLWNINTSEI